MKLGIPPAVDGDFYAAMVGDAGKTDRWTPLMRDTAGKLIEKKQRIAAVFLAWQVYQLGDLALADNLLAIALDGVPEKESFATQLAAIEFLTQTSQLARADDLLRALLTDEKHRDDADLWRLASRLADQRGDEARAVAALEKALDHEYADLPDVIQLESWRHDYGRLLGHYKTLALRAEELHVPAPSDLAARVVRAADRWRAHDPEGQSASQQAGDILRRLGQRDLAWDYYTTPFAGQPERAGGVRDLAVTLGRAGAPDLAEYGFAVAVDVNPDEPRIVWDRAMNLREAGRPDEARKWLQTLADDTRNDWTWRHVRERARFELNRK
jgi:tetratricopeptide (TPR) repeat protein